MGRTRVMSVFLGLALAASAVGAGDPVEARVSLDVKEAPVEAIVGLLVELGGRQVVFDPGLDCALTLRLHEVAWPTALDTTLRACGLGYQEQGGVVWVATTGRLRAEAESRRRLQEARPTSRRGLALYRLSYARAEELAPLLRRFVAPTGSVSTDPRTNTLVIRY